MAHPHHRMVTQKLQPTYFNVLRAYFIIGPNVRWHYAGEYGVGTFSASVVYSSRCVDGCREVGRQSRCSLQSTARRRLNEHQASSTTAASPASRPQPTHTSPTAPTRPATTRAGRTAPETEVTSRRRHVVAGRRRRRPVSRRTT